MGKLRLIADYDSLLVTRKSSMCQIMACPLKSHQHNHLHSARQADLDHVAAQWQWWWQHNC